MAQSKTLKEKSTNKNHYDDNYNCYGDTIQNTEISTFSIFDFVVYTVWACWKAMTPSKTLKEESSSKKSL